MPRKRFIGAALALCAAGSTLLASSASAQLDEVNTKKLRDAVTVNGMMQHERALQAIANANGGTRASGTPGYDASAAYVKGRLQRPATGHRAGVHVPVLPQARAEPTLREGPPAPKRRTRPTTSSSPAAARSPARSSRRSTTRSRRGADAAVDRGLRAG